ncbi:hypothetical protein CFAM422_000971 [Trichoderma lentiforme]|uniref:Uncharacterized protein n=1 Tax=Trichoderma lentiforme TaxID=1567552 RepID=A0A9P5CFT1_9HYPO|nr:hypothetical protein CFAM422_000971 [Trichoderma lentiforme]
MGRAYWKNLPDDPEKRPQFIKKIIEQSDSNLVKDIRQHEYQRNLSFRSDDYPTSVKIHELRSKIAAAIQQRGDIAHNPCGHCEQGIGPFIGCIHIQGMQHGRCGNCIYEGEACTNADDGKKEFATLNMNSSRTGTGPVSGASHHPSPSSTVLEEQASGEAEEQASDTDNADSYLVLGKFVLPRPPKELKNRAEKWEPHLAKLNARNMEDLRDRPIRDLDKSFLEFQARESDIFQSVFSKPPSPELLVKPSGSLASPLAHRLHQPSFTTDCRDNAETADPSNGCLAMVMGNVYNRDTLVFDHIHRRDAQSEGIQQYPPRLLSSHEDFTRDIAQSMTAKVEILYGKKLQQRVLQTQGFEILPLWGEFEGVVLLLALESSYGNADPRYRFRRIMLVASHPQHMFYQSRGNATALRQDKVMEAAALMVCSAVPWVGGYFSDKLWMSCVPSQLQLKEIRQFGKILGKEERIPTVLQIDEDEAGKLDKSAEWGAWGVYFDAQPHSNSKLMGLIPPALEALEALGTLDSSNAWNELTDLPEPVLEWIRGQKQALFPDVPLSNFSEMISALEEFLEQPIPKPVSEPVKWILIKVLRFQEQFLEASPGRGPEYLYSTFGKPTIELKCNQCNQLLAIENNPLWLVYRPGTLSCTSMRCPSKSCKKKTRTLIPVDGSIPSSRSVPTKQSLTPAAQSKTSPYEDYIFQEGAEEYKLPTKVICRCILCGIDEHIDNKPRWTIGSHFYLERRLNCKNKDCPARGGRFIPIEDIDSIAEDNIRSLNRQYRGLSLETRLTLMAGLKPSSRKARKSKK